MTGGNRLETWTGHTYAAVLALVVALLSVTPVSSGGETVEGTQWAPYLEWSLAKTAYRGDPYDVSAIVTFTHTASGRQRVTETFYDGNKTWKFRFTGTRLGEWTFETSSTDRDFNGRTGTVIIHANPDRNTHGFVTALDDNRWGRQATQQIFVPQLAMYKTPNRFYDRPDVVDADIQEFLIEHGFNGFHVPSIAGRWFDVDTSDNRVAASMTRPDPRTFEALEMLIAKVYAAGGMVHIWAWGDHQRHQTPRDLSDGINGRVDRRLQRYIAARLGPIPGWSMGYGFDLWEWVQGSELTGWHDYMHEHMGWAHLLGARASKNTLEQLSEALDYSGYEQHRPDYAKYVETLEARPDKPSFSEDRFRLRNEGRSKDHTAEETRRGLWHSTMAGGVANIWGNLLEDGHTRDSELGSAPYPNKDQIKTYAIFWNDLGRFVRGLQRAQQLSRDPDTRILRQGHDRYVFYREGTTSIHMDLSGMSGPAMVVAVDTKKRYAEIRLGNLDPGEHTWHAPYASDWAVAVGTWVSARRFTWDQVALLARHWLRSDCGLPDGCQGTDRDRNGTVAWTDFALLAPFWQPLRSAKLPARGGSFYRIENSAVSIWVKPARPTVVKP